MRSSMGSDLKWLEVRKWSQIIQKTTSGALKTAEILYHSRQGTVVEKGLALMTLAGLAAEALIPPPYANNRLKDAGWNKVASSQLAVVALAELLNISKKSDNIYLDSAEQAESNHYSSSKATVWRDGSGNPLVVVTQYTHSYTMWEREEGLVSDMIQSVFWKANGYAVNINGLEYDFDGSEQKVSYSPLRVAGDYIGNDMLAQVKDAFLSSDYGLTRVVLLVGPTGAGKTTLSCTALGPNTRVVKLPDPSKITANSALELLKVIKPQVVLLDDIPMPREYEKMDEGLTSLLDNLHSVAKLVVCTFMDDSIVSVDQLKPGVFYYPGMRSGRVDQVIFMGPPNRDERFSILRHYGLSFEVACEVSLLTDGLTGAYLKEVANRILVKKEQPSHAVNLIRLQAPIAMSKSKDQDDDE